MTYFSGLSDYKQRNSVTKCWRFWVHTSTRIWGTLYYI